LNVDRLDKCGIRALADLSVYDWQTAKHQPRAPSKIGFERLGQFVFGALKEMVYRIRILSLRFGCGEPSILSRWY